MQARYVDVLLRRNMAETLALTVYEHEVEVLKDVHGDAAVEVVGRADYPPVELDAADEYNRLKTRFGANDAGQAYVERVFGISARSLEDHAAKHARRGRRAAEEEAA